MLHHKSYMILVIISVIVNFKPESKDVLAEVLLNKKKKPELAKVYAKKLWKRQGRSNVALIRFYRQQRCFCVVLNTAKQWEHVTAQSLAKINWDSSLCTEDHAVILALISKRFLLNLLVFLADGYDQNLDQHHHSLVSTKTNKQTDNRTTYCCFRTW